MTRASGKQTCATREVRTNLAEECAEIFYAAKIQDGKWKSIPRATKENYISAMEKVLYHIKERSCG